MRDDRFLGVRLDVDAGRQPAPTSSPRQALPASGTPFRIAVLGDFSGSGHRGAIETGRALAERRPRRVDRDNFDAVLAQLAPQLVLPVAEDGGAAAIGFGELDDFHPDRLVERLPVFQWLSNVRAALTDNPPKGPRRGEGARAVTTRTTRNVPAQPSSGSLLDQMLDDTPNAPGAPGSEPTRTAPPARGGDLQEYIDRLVEPHLVHDTDPRLTELLDQVDQAAAAQMRAVLGHPAFRALESLWRGLFFLVRRVETGGDLQIWLIDVADEELRRDLVGAEDAGGTALHRLLVESSAGTFAGEPWAVLVGSYSFGAGDAEVLGRLAAVARAVGAPWISGAEPALAGFASFHGTPDWSDWKQPADHAWDRVRHSSDARHLGLAAPRFLIRLPYGLEGEPTERIRFEETEEAPAHDEYLWGNPAIVCALLLAESFTASGWALTPGERLDVENLPLHVTRTDGEATAKPCAEALLTERAARAMLDSGVMPLASMKGRDAVRLLRFQSIAAPAASLAGRWEGGADAADA